MADRDMESSGRTHCVFRFGQRIHGDDVPCVPVRYRESPGEPHGKLEAVRLRAASGEVWLRLRQGDAPWKRQMRTIPLNMTQAPAPTPDSIELHANLLVRCHDGVVGRLEGVRLDVRIGLALDLLTHVRGNILADVDSSTAPLAALLSVSGQRVLLSPAWAVSATHPTARAPLQAAHDVLLLDASAEQIASATLLRPDGVLANNIITQFNENRALAPYTARIAVRVRDGDVLLTGTVPTIRHRASAEQEAWHIPGVLSVENALRTGA